MKKIISILLALVMVFALVACGAKTDTTDTKTGDSTAPAASTGDSTAPAGEETPKAAPEKLTIGFVGNLGRFLAGISPAENFTACDAVFDTIFKTNATTKEVYSDILDSWEWTDDTTFVMHMKDCVYFSNGENATAEDLLFSYTNHPERGSNYLNSFGIIFDQCEVTDEYTVTMKFEQPYPLFVNTAIYLIDKSWSEEVGWDSMDWYTPVCSGPYKCTEYVADDHMVLEARDDYWNKDAGEIGVKTIICKNYADYASLYMDLEIGNLDLCQLQSSDYTRWLSSGNEDFGCALAPTGVVCYFNFGFLCDDIWYNQKLREAIAYGVNWDELGQLVYGDMYIPADSVVPASSPEYMSPGKVSYDPDKAKELLAEAGYEPGELTIKTFMMEQPFYHSFCEGFQFYCQELGINVELEFGDVSTAIAKWVDVNSGIDFGFFFGVMGSPTGNLRAGLWNAGDLNGVKWGYVGDDELQEAFARHIYSTDKEESIAASKECQQIIFDKTLIVPIAEVVMAVGYNAKTMTEQQAMDFYSGSDNFQISRLGMASAWE